MDVDLALRNIVRTPRDTGFYETLVYLVYRDWVAKPGSTAIDVGAHTGLHTFRLAECVGKKGRVFAFEPLSEFASQIEAEAAARYGTGNRVHVSSVALSDVDGDAVFYRNPEAPWQSTLVAGHVPNPCGSSWEPSEDHRSATEPVPIRVATLDKVLDPAVTKYVSVLKIDAEGAEFKILNGARNLLSRSSPLIVLEFMIEQLELLGKQPNDFFDLVEDIGYVFFNIDGTEYDRRFIENGRSIHCYERFGAKRGHWIEGFLRTKMRGLVERHIGQFTSSRGIAIDVPR
jgi:FkbM family methyltransferase